MDKSNKKSVFEKVTYLSKFYFLDMFSFLVHFVWIFLFYYEKVYFLSAINIGSSVIYLCLFYLICKRRVSNALFVCVVEVLVHSVIAVLCFGTSGAFDLYILALIPIIFFFSLTYDNRENIIRCGGIFVGLVYLGLKLLLCVYETQYKFSSVEIEMEIVLFNCITILIMFSTLANIIIAERRQISRKLEEKNVELEFISKHDYLTKLLNRRSLKEVTKKIEKENIACNNCFSVAFIDIDDFKIFNDKYGHDFGDVVLVRVAEIIKENAGSNGHVCRWGGEEIVIVFYPCEVEVVKNTMYKIREKICSEELKYENKKVHVTVTCGVAFSKENMEKTIAKADSLMLQGKENGKNCIMAEY